MSAPAFASAPGDDGTQSLSSSRNLRPLAEEDPPRLGPYRLTHRIPGGNPDTVKYLGWDQTHTPHLLKVLRGADGPIQFRMRREVLAAARVHSPRVARVLGFFQEGEYSFIVQRFVAGPTLRDVLSSASAGCISGRDLRRVALGLAKALRDVRKGNVVHGDPTPVNVIVNRKRLVLVDLGAARVLGEIRHEVYGAPFYCAPEQLEGQDIEPPTDVYIWALTVAEAGTGHRPFDPTGTLSAEEYGLAVRNEQPVLDGLPPELRAVLAEALVPDPVARPSIAEVVRRLEDHALRNSEEPTHSLAPFTQRLTHDLVDHSDDDPLVPLAPTVREFVRYGYWREVLRAHGQEIVYRIGTQWSAVAVSVLIAFVLAFLTAVGLFVGAELVVGS